MMEFYDIKIETVDLLRKTLKCNKNICCELSASNLFTWNVNQKLKYSLLDGYPIFRIIEKNVAAYSFPDLKADKKDIIDACIEDALSMNKIIIFRHLSKQMKEEMEKLYKNQFVYAINRDNSDYIYCVDDLAKLQGKKYHGKKNHINQFIKQNEYSYEKITSDNILECKQLLMEWTRNKETIGEQVNQVELDVLEKVFHYYDTLNLVGGLVRVNGQVKAFSIGEELSNDTFVTHFEKADSTIRGLYAYINQAFTQNELLSYKYVNREEDMGVFGIRKAKLSYHPYMMWDKYEAMNS